MALPVKFNRGQPNQGIVLRNTVVTESPDALPVSTADSDSNAPTTPAAPSRTAPVTSGRTSTKFTYIAGEQMIPTDQFNTLPKRYQDVLIQGGIAAFNKLAKQENDQAMKNWKAEVSARIQADAESNILPPDAIPSQSIDTTGMTPQQAADRGVQGVVLPVGVTVYNNNVDVFGTQIPLSSWDSLTPAEQQYLVQAGASGRSIETHIQAINQQRGQANAAVRAALIDTLQVVAQNPDLLKAYTTTHDFKLAQQQADIASGNLTLERAEEIAMSAGLAGVNSYQQSQRSAAQGQMVAALRAVEAAPGAVTPDGVVDIAIALSHGLSLQTLIDSGKLSYSDAVRYQKDQAVSALPTMKQTAPELFDAGGNLILDKALARGIDPQFIVDSGAVPHAMVVKYFDDQAADLKANYTKLPDNQYIKNTDLADLPPELQDIALSSGFSALQLRIDAINREAADAAARIAPYRTDPIALPPLSAQEALQFAQSGKGRRYAPPAQGGYNLVGMMQSGDFTDDFLTQQFGTDAVVQARNQAAALRVLAPYTIPLEGPTQTGTALPPLIDIVSYLRDKGEGSDTQQVLSAIGYTPAQIKQAGNMAALATADKLIEQRQQLLKDYQAKVQSTAVAYEAGIAKLPGQAVGGLPSTLSLIRAGNAVLSSYSPDKQMTIRSSQVQASKENQSAFFAAARGALIPGVQTRRDIIRYSADGNVQFGEGAIVAGDVVLDLLTVLPFIGAVAVGAKTAAGVGRGARILAGAKAIPRALIEEVKSPVLAVIHPVETAKGAVRTVKGATDLIRGRMLPLDTVSILSGTARLDARIVGSEEAAQHVRDVLTAKAAAGAIPEYTFAGKTYKLRQSALMESLGGGVVHSGPDIRFTTQPGGAQVLAKLYPEGHPRAGQRMTELEQGLFVSPTPLEQFTRGSAFGLERLAANADPALVARNASVTARTAGNTKLSSKLNSLAKEYDAAKTAQSIRNLNSAETRIATAIRQMAVDAAVANINRLRQEANSLLSIGDVSGAQERMAASMALEQTLEPAVPGFYVVGPETTFGKPDAKTGIMDFNKGLSTVPTNKLFPGMVFSPRGGQIWGLVTAQIKGDRGAKLLSQAADMRKLGNVEEAKRLEDEAESLIKAGKTGFKKIDSVEMERKFPELANMPEVKGRYYTRSAEGKKLAVYTDRPLDAITILKLKLSGNLEMLRNIYEPAISVREVPLTLAERATRVENLIKEADRIASSNRERSSLLRLEADSLARTASSAPVTAKNARVAVEADSYAQSARRAEILGDMDAARILRREAASLAALRGTRLTQALRARDASALSRIASATGIDLSRLTEVPAERAVPRVPVAERIALRQLDSRSEDRRDQIRAEDADRTIPTPSVDNRVADRTPVESRTISRLDSRRVDATDPRVTGMRDVSASRETSQREQRITPRLPSIRGIRETDIRRTDGERVIRPPVRRLDRTEIRIPPPPPRIEKYPPTMKPGIGGSNQEAKRQLFKDAVTFKAGFGWWALKAPYKSQADIAFFKGSPPPGARVVEGGPQAAYRSIQAITGEDVPADLHLNMGIVHLVIKSPEQLPGKTGSISFVRGTDPAADIDLRLHGTEAVVPSGINRVASGSTHSVIPAGSLAWRGEDLFWYYLPAGKWDSGSPIQLSRPPMGATNLEGTTPAETLQLVGRSRTSPALSDMTINLPEADIVVSDKGKSLSYEPKGILTESGFGGAPVASGGLSRVDFNASASRTGSRDGIKMKSLGSSKLKSKRSGARGVSVSGIMKTRPGVLSETTGA